jgi:hypothetical protein
LICLCCEIVSIWGNIEARLLPVPLLSFMLANGQSAEHLYAHSTCRTGTIVINIFHQPPVLFIEYTPSQLYF